MNGEDIDLEEIDHRLKKLEKSLGPENSHERLNRQMDRLVYRVDQLEQRQQSNEKMLLEHVKKTDNLIEHLFQCRKYPQMC